MFDLFSTLYQTAQEGRTLNLRIIFTFVVQWLPWHLHPWHQRWPFTPFASWYPAPSCPLALSSSPSSTGQLASTTRPSQHNTLGRSRRSVPIHTDNQALNYYFIWSEILSEIFMPFPLIWSTSPRTQLWMINKLDWVGPVDNRPSND